MIAQLKQTLQQNAIFERRNSEKASAEMSIKERLAALNNSSNQWQHRAPRPQPPAPHRRSSSNVLQDLPILQKLQQQHLPRSQPVVQEKPCDITSGLKKFFSSAPTSSGATDDEIDLDAISASARPVLKTVCRPRAPNRKKAAQTATFDDRIRLDAVKINEEELVEEEEEPEKLETQEQAIAALKSAKQLLKSPTKKSPYPDVMLIQVRGAKHTDVRLVAPTMASIHEYACFVVVHQKHLMKYEGAMANILEKTKAAQLCIEIQGKSDLNCSAETIVTVTESSKSALSKLLFCSENDSPVENNNYQWEHFSTEPFETTASKLNLVFRIADDRSAQTCSRRERLSVGILQSSETLIFDFGSEIYIWTGRYSSKVNAAYAMEYAKQLMEKGVKNSKTVLGGGDSELSEDKKRPEWTLFRKIHQGVLDTLFKAKFSDWPESREVVTTCIPKALFSKKKPELKTYEDVKVANQDEEVDQLVERMLDEPEMDPILVLEDQEVDRKMQDVITEDRTLWILGGEILKSIPFTEQLDSSRCYVLRWQYRIQKSGVRRIKTGKEEERETGRSRIAFFYWLGERTTPKQHGLCALRIKDIDRDNSPRIRVADGNEPALFLALFDGKFLVSSNDERQMRRFVVIGANAQETSLREIDDLNAKLRSHAAYIETPDSGPSIVCGANCTPEQVRFVLAHADHLRQKAGVSGKAKVEVEGDTKTHQWVNSAGRKRAMRVWRIFENEAEQTNHLSGHKDCAFTFSQQILTETILIDVGEALWLWSEDVVTTFALKVADKYWKTRTGSARIVYKGAEPEEFQALFLKWETVEVENRMDPRNLKELLAERCRTFSIEELKERTNLPAGMDMRRLESYLTDDDFQKTFGIGRAEFYAQKAWKQNEARKRVGLF